MTSEPVNICYTGAYMSVHTSTHADTVSKTFVIKIYMDIHYISNMIMFSNPVFVGI